MNSHAPLKTLFATFYTFIVHYVYADELVCTPRADSETDSGEFIIQIF